MEREPRDWILRIGNGIHFSNSAPRGIWGINTKHPDGKYFTRGVRPGDRLWFVRNKTENLLCAVAVFTENMKRETGPLIPLTLTDEDLGWNDTLGEWDTEVHFKELQNITPLGLQIQKRLARNSINVYSKEKHGENLPEEFRCIMKYGVVKPGCPHFQ
jgi:hypothetical protein